MDTICAPVIERLTSVAGLPSAVSSTPSLMSIRGERRVPVTSSRALRSCVDGAAADSLSAASGVQMRRLDHANVTAGQRWVAFDAVDEGDAARGAGERPIHGNDAGL